MNKIISAIMGFIGTAITATLIGSGVLLLAGEIRLASLKKASQGSTKLNSIYEENDRWFKKLKRYQKLVSRSNFFRLELGYKIVSKAKEMYK